MSQEHLTRIKELDAIQCDVCGLTHPIGECSIKKLIKILDIQDEPLKEGQIQQGDILGTGIGE